MRHKKKNWFSLPWRQMMTLGGITLDFKREPWLEPITWSTRKSLSQSVCQYIYSSLSQPVCQLLNQRVNHSAGKWSSQLETALIEGDVYFNKVMLLFLKNWNIHNKSETCSNTIHCLLCLWKWACALQWLALPFQNNHCKCPLLL